MQTLDVDVGPDKKLTDKIRVDIAVGDAGITEHCHKWTTNHVYLLHISCYYKSPSI